MVGVVRGRERNKWHAQREKNNVTRDNDRGLFIEIAVRGIVSTLSSSWIILDLDSARDEAFPADVLRGALAGDNIGSGCG